MLGHTEEPQKALFPRVVMSQESTVGRIYIGPKSEMIAQNTYIYVKAAVDHFITTKPAFVILELNTPGGEVFAADNISRCLKSLDRDHNIPVIAYINNWAISAGASLAYSCRYIISEPDGSMGAATPVIMTEQGMAPTNEKMISALRADFANKASFFERNPLIAEAMVDPDIILVKRGEKIIKLSNEEAITSTDQIISLKGKPLTLTAQEMKEYGVIEYILPKESLQKDEGYTPKNISDTVFKNITPFREYQSVPVDTFTMDYKTAFIAYLSSPYVASFLVFVVMIAGYLELSTPGATIPGLVAGVALFLLLVSSNAQESIRWFEPIVVLFGVLLIVSEILFFPTMGFLISSGIFFIACGTILMLIPQAAHDILPLPLGGEPHPDEASLFGIDYAIHLLTIISCGIIAAAICIFLLLRHNYRPKILYNAHLILNSSSPPPPSNVGKEEGLSVGSTVIVVSTLRPAGKIEYKGNLYDAMSYGEYIERGKKVTVVEIRGDVIYIQ